MTATRAEPPEGEWSGSTANGVTTINAFSPLISVPWESAFTFEGAQAPEPLPACAPLEEAEELACFCSPEAPEGEVWGAGPYTADGDICATARHAGVIDHHGDNVRVIRGPGQESYPASISAGMRAAEHGPSEASISFGSFE